MARTVAGGIRPERGNRTFLVLAVVVALIAAVLVFVALNRGGGDEQATSSAATVDVVVAAQDIPAGTRLTEGMLKIAPVSSQTLLQGTYTEVPALAGFVTRYPVAPGEQITPAKIGLESENQEGLSFIIPAGQRAIAVSVTQVSSVGGLLLPGDRVDVIAVATASEVDSDVERDFDVAFTVLQNIEVLAVAQATVEPVPPPQSTEEGEAAGEQPLAERPADAEPQPDATTVTLAVTPEQAQLLALVDTEGDVWLSLRPFGEDAPIELPPVASLGSLSELIDAARLISLTGTRGP
jgi:pilus assembly protein CpaB